VSGAILRAVPACLAGALALALLAAGPAGAAFSTPEYESTINGAGDHAIGEPLAVAVDEETHDFYVADRGNRRIEKFDSAGNFILMFGAGVNETTGGNVCPAAAGDVCGPGEDSDAFPDFANPSSIAVDNSDGSSKGSVYVAEGSANGGDDTISKFDSGGHLVAGWGNQGTLQVATIRKVTVSPFDGRVWVLDGICCESPGATDGGHIMAYTEDGAQIFRVESRRQPGNDGTMAIDADDRLWFSDQNESPTVLDISRYGETGNHPLGALYTGQASHFAVNPVNSDVLAVFNGYEVNVFERSCEPALGYCLPKESFGAGQLTEPRGLAIDGSTGSVYVAVSGGVAAFRSLVVPDVVPKPASVGHTGAVLSAHLDPLAAGQITGCEVEYGPTTDYGSTASCDQTLPLDGPTDVTVHLSGLSTETPYHYRFNATNGNGTSHGPDRTFTPHWVTGLETGAATQIEAGTATLHGELDPDGEPTRYFFEWGTSKNYGHRTPELPGAQTSADGLIQVEATLTGLLTSMTTYHYRLVAVNSLGTSYGSDREFTTPLGGPPQLTGVAGVPTGPTGAVLRAEVNPGFGDTAYTFQYGADSSYGRSTVIGPPIANDGTFHPVSAELTGLLPETTYHFRAIAFNFVDRVTSADMTFTTPPVTPSTETPAGGGQAAPPIAIAPPKRKPVRKCKKGFVRKKGKCVKKRHRRPAREGRR
jgi:hypothetical protein